LGLNKVSSNKSDTYVGTKNVFFSLLYELYLRPMVESVSFFKVRFLGTFGHLAVLAVGFGASLAGEVMGSNFFIRPRQERARDEP
jgi:hypothetical protein